MATLWAASFKSRLDLFGLKDDSLDDRHNLPAPAVIVQEIVEDLKALLEQFNLFAGDLGPMCPKKRFNLGL